MRTTSKPLFDTHGALGKQRHKRISTARSLPLQEHIRPPEFPQDSVNHHLGAKHAPSPKMSTPSPKRIYVAGHRGMVGSAILRALQRGGAADIVTRPHADLDLTEQAQVRAFSNRNGSTRYIWPPPMSVESTPTMPIQRNSFTAIS